MDLWFWNCKSVICFSSLLWSILAACLLTTAYCSCIIFVYRSKLIYIFNFMAFEMEVLLDKILLEARGVPWFLIALQWFTCYHGFACFYQNCGLYVICSLHLAKHSDEVSHGSIGCQQGRERKRVKGSMFPKVLHTRLALVITSTLLLIVI
jgi:hypothetical protein